MKKLYFLLISIFAINICNAQWTALSSGTTNDLHHVFFTDVNTGYVGTQKTIDAGVSWTTMPKGYWSSFYTGSNIGYDVSIGSKWISKTYDAGLNWSDIFTAGVFCIFTSVYFTDFNNGYVVGSDSGGYLILKTINSGVNWSKQVFGGPSGSSVFIDLVFTNSNTGYVVGNNGVLLKTINAGSTWSPITSGTFNNLRSIYFTDANVGYICGASGTILKTIDAGSTWSSLNSGITTSLNSIYFTNSNTGYVVGGSGVILKTINSGDSWTLQPSGTTRSLNSILFTNTNTGYIAGHYGTILKTTNGGGTGISEISSNNLVSLYPNPTSNNLIIDLQALNDVQNTTISIYDIQGQLLLQQTIEQSLTTLNIASFAKGIYVVKVNNDKLSVVSKFIKE